MSFDVLVIGSGASGLAAAVSADRAGARVGLATKGALQSCNSAKAQGGIQAAFGEDDSPELHAEDVWKSSHETADRRLVKVLTDEAPDAIHWLEGQGVEFTREDATRAGPPPRARRALDEPSWRDGRGDANRARARGRGSRPRRVAVPPERRRLAAEHAGLLDPGDDARVRRDSAERRGGGVHGSARPAGRRLRGHLQRGRGGAWR